jgi:hypothetical protein
MAAHTRCVPSEKAIRVSLSTAFEIFLRQKSMTR